MVRDKPITSNKRRNFQGYFDEKGYNITTPNHRSLPKRKTVFQQKKNKKQIDSRRQSAGKKKSNKKEGSPYRFSKFEQSVHREYDSPSKDQEELQFILAERPNKGKSGAMVEKTIDRVNEKLKKNQLALQSQPNSYDLNYLLGVCYLINSSYDEAINAFDNLLRKKPRKNIFLLLSVCYKKIDDLEQTQTILDDCLMRYPKYYEAYIYRGKLYLKQKKFKKALIDFEKAISINSNKQIGYVGKGDCLRLMERYDEAKSVYTVALHTKTNNASILLRRSICNMQLKKYQTAFDDINQLLKFDPQNSQALYFKGLIYNKQKLHNEAIICYEQAIKFNSNKKAVTRSIYEISKIKIEHRDYYEALYTLERAQFLDIDEKVIKKFKYFTDGVTYMMKKNYQDGLKSLDLLVGCDEKPLSNFLKPLFYSTRAYGNMSLEKFSQAKNDLQIMEKQFSLDFPNLYNKFICEGILACNSQKYEQALAFFSKAGKAIPQRQQPPFYKALTLICFANKLIPKNMKEKKQEYLESAMKTISKMQTPIQNNPSLFIIRGFLHFALGQPMKALENFDDYLKEANKPTALVNYLYGIVLGSIGKYPQAVDEFSKALNAHDAKQIPQIYLNKAKCLLLSEEINTGFINLQTYMSHKPSSPDIHIWAGHLLFRIGAYEDAAKAYSNINNIAKNFQVLFYRAKCYLAFKDVISTITNLKLMLDLKYDNKIFFDHRMLEALRECSEDADVDFGVIKNSMKEAKQKSSQMGGSSFGDIFKQQDYQFYKAVMYFYEGKYQSAIKNFKRALNLTEKYIQENSKNNEELIDFYKPHFQNKTYNFLEINYNIAIAEIMFGNILKGVKIIKMIIDKAPAGQIKNQLELFANLLSKQISKQFQSKRKQEEQAQFFPFPFDNRLCSIFPEIVLKLSTPIKTRLYFCLPYVEKPDIKPRFEEKLLQEFDMKRIQTKPEAPWIRRSEQGVIFTDEIMGCDVELSSSGEDEVEHHEHDDERQGDETGQQGEQQDNQFEEEYNEHVLRQDNDSDHGGRLRNDDSGQDERQIVMNPNQLKQFFKLDKKTQERLALLKQKEKEK